MSAFGIGEQVALVFNTVLNELTRGLEDEDEEVQQPADRAYWEERADKDILAMTDQLLATVRQWDPQLETKYSKGYVVFAKNGAPDKFVTFRPKQQFLRVEVRVPQSEEVDKRLEDAGLSVMPYRWRKYRIRLTKPDLATHEALIVQLMRSAYENRAL